jgi:hypothetical protein
MQKQTRSLLQELESIGSQRDRKHVIESRASNIITSAINLLDMINETFDKDQAEILERKLLNAIKSRDIEKFNRSIKKNS